MLGKTNITMIEKGAIVSDIAEYSWNAADITGIYGTFIKAVYENNTLVGITRDGNIAYTKDGENWETAKPDIENDIELYDMIWDGSRYIFVGSTDGLGVVITSEDLIKFNKEIDESNYCSRFFAIFMKDGKYVLIGAGSTTYQTNSGGHRIFSWIGDIGSWTSQKTILNYTVSGTIDVKTPLDNIDISIAKKSTGYLLYIKQPKMITTSTTYYDNVYLTSDGATFNLIKQIDAGSNSEALISVFECKDNLYYISRYLDDNYTLAKVTNSGETLVMQTGIDFAFTDAVYFNKCEIFINDHDMLIVRPSENLSEMKLEDMVEITYDFSLIKIVKAFDKLFIFGTKGNVLISDDEVKNEDALAVKTMSAFKALYEAKAYTDEIFAELEARITALETGV